MSRLLIVDTDANIYAEKIAANLSDGPLLHAATTLEEGLRHIREAKIILGRPDFVAQLLPQAKSLAWVQSTYAGVEDLCAPGQRRDYLLTGVKDVFGPLISEYVMAYVLALERHLFETRELQRRKRWRSIPYRGLQDITIGIAGLGSIGRRLAGTCAHFGMRVLGLKHRAEEVPHVEEVFQTRDLEKFLGPLDYLVLALPDAPGTRHIIDAPALAHMKRSAVLINVGRGTAVDQDALAAALEAECIRAAVLDVFEDEPLPPTDRLWELPNALITPHNAAFSFPSRIAAIFCENYRRFVQGRPLKYAVDFQQGY